MSKLSKFFSNNKKRYATQKRNRCRKCGKSRGFISLFQCCRICVRQFVSYGHSPGFVKID